MGSRASSHIRGEGRPSCIRGGPSSAHRAADTLATVEPFIRLTVPALPEQVGLIRRVLDALAETVPLPPRTLEDMRLVVTEACTNVVRHAYGRDGGPLEVVIRPRDEAVEVIVSDRGRGVHPRTDSDGPGLGLSLIAALTERLDVAHTPGGGTRLAMSFSLRSADPVSVEAG
jgi:serine/threonine-protein kinase RsbW